LTHDGDWSIDGERFDAAIVAVPAEQVEPLVIVHDAAVADAARSAVSDPCWTVMAAFDGVVPIDTDRLTDVGIIGSAVRNSAKPGRTGPEAWVLQANADWSRVHLEDEREMVEQTLLEAFVDHIDGGMPALIATRAHRWRYAKAKALNGKAFWNADIRLGACGDWLFGPRIEAAWLSGQKLAELVDGQQSAVPSAVTC
jgi:renalase